MPVFNAIIKAILNQRYHRIENFMNHPLEVQERLFHELVKKGRHTHWGHQYDYKHMPNYSAFAERVPLQAYEDLFPFIDRMMRGEQGLLWPSKIVWFSKSSGTTNDRSKFIPVSREALEDNHYQGGKDLLSIYFQLYPNSKLFRGKGLAIGGSYTRNPVNHRSFYGDVSAVIMANLPPWAQFARTPSLKVALMSEWEEKIEKLARLTSGENVTNISGVPTWNLILLERILQFTGKANMLEVWPNFECFFHGAVSFTPYESVFKTFFPSTEVNYMETYNASEGFFGIQDRQGSKDLLLMLDYGVFYEFIPIEEVDSDNPKVLPLSAVEKNKTYAMVISTNSGLWRYKLGDTVRFVSTNPYRIRIAGRTKHFINAFGEELMVENAEVAISKACVRTGAAVKDFTAAPVFFENSKSKGGHEWAIEFATAPNDLVEFARVLDEELRIVNSDYDAKRYKDMALVLPLVQLVPNGTFYAWMKGRGKLGAQNKVPRLSNDRVFLEEVLTLSKS